MKLNPVQVASLTRLLAYRAKSPSFGHRLRLSAAAMLLLLPATVVLGYLVVRLDIPGGILLAVGLLAGAFLWDMLQQQRFIEWWPLNREITDWSVVLTASWCAYCMQLREQLAANRIPYTDMDVEKSAAGRWAYTAVHGTDVPITVVGDQIVRGNRRQQIDRALKAAGYRELRMPNAAAFGSAETAFESVPMR